jgi:hypothetical protein
MTSPRCVPGQPIVTDTTPWQWVGRLWRRWEWEIAMAPADSGGTPVRRNTQHVADPLLNNRVGDVVELRRFGIDDDTRAPAAFA